jgi:hypothetical protein
MQQVLCVHLADRALYVPQPSGNCPADLVERASLAIAQHNGDFAADRAVGLASRVSGWDTSIIR